MNVLAYLDPGSGSVLGPLEVVIVILAWIAPAVLVAKYAESKGQSFAAFLLIGLLVSWVVSAVAALVVTDRRVPQPVVVTGAPADPLDQLKTLTELREAGTLTDQEFETEKARIMGQRS
jgi:putative oligomerization/nucleic acid binding protein